MEVNIQGSRLMRISYAVAKVVAFVLIIAAQVPVCPFADIIGKIGYWSAVFAIVFCVVRGLPVVIEAKRVIEEE